MENEKNNLSGLQHTKEYGNKLWELVKRSLDKVSAAELAEVEHIPISESHDKSFRLLRFLSIYPYLLFILFIVSFFWDFDGRILKVASYQFPLEGLLRILTTSGLIGFLTNWVAITMLFRPVFKRPLLGQGLVPAQKERIAFRLALAVSEDLINPEIIKQKINESQTISKYRKIATQYLQSIISDEEFKNGIKQLVYNYLNEMLADPEIRSGLAKSIIEQIEKSFDTNILEKVALKAYSFIKGREMQALVEDAILKLPENIDEGLDKLNTVLDNLPDKITEHSEPIENAVTSLLYLLINRLDVRALVQDNLMKYDERGLEKLIKNASNDQLQYIQYLGAVLGTLGGFVIWKPVGSLIILSGCIILVVLTDVLLVTLRREKK